MSPKARLCQGESGSSQKAGKKLRPTPTIGGSHELDSRRGK